MREKKINSYLAQCPLYDKTSAFPGGVRNDARVAERSGEMTPGNEISAGPFWKTGISGTTSRLRTRTYFVLTYLYPLWRNTKYLFRDGAL